jgi:hypothetical protein
MEFSNCPIATALSQTYRPDIFFAKEHKVSIQTQALWSCSRPPVVLQVASRLESDISEIGRDAEKILIGYTPMLISERAMMSI